MSAVARASWQVERHRPAVVTIEYTPPKKKNNKSHQSKRIFTSSARELLTTHAVLMLSMVETCVE